VGIRGVPYAPARECDVPPVVVLDDRGAGSTGGALLASAWADSAGSGPCSSALALGLFAQILVFGFTVISFAGHFSNSYYLNPDALNVPEGTVITWAHILGPRTGGLVVNCILAIVAASLGRVLSFLAPKAEA
jgi:hypothetical protein